MARKYCVGILASVLMILQACENFRAIIRLIKPVFLVSKTTPKPEFSGSGKPGADTLVATWGLHELCVEDTWL